MLSKEYIVLALLKAKSDFFREYFVTMEELNHFIHFMQQEFIKQELEIVIKSNFLDKANFVIVNGIVMVSDHCCYSLDQLSLNADLYHILTDENLLLTFFINLEKDKLKILETRESNLPNPYKHERKLS